MSNGIYVTPYIAPPIDEELCDIFKKYGKKIKLKKKEFILRKNVINSFIFVDSGLLGRVRETPLPLKQNHLEIIPPKRVANFINFFSPGKVRISVISLRSSEVYITPFDVFQKLKRQNDIINQKMEEMYGANAETTLRSSSCNFIFPCEYRLLSLFKAIVKQSNLTPDADGWVQLPYKLTREEYCQIIFSSLLTLDNILQQWKKENLYRKMKEGSFVHINLLKKDIFALLSKPSAPSHTLQTIHTLGGYTHKV